MPQYEVRATRSLEGFFNARVFWLQSRALTAANLKSRYRNTFAGFLWVILSPLITYSAQAYVFHVILRLQVDNYHLFLMSGLLPWIFIQQSAEMCTSLYTGAARLLKSFPVHPLVFLASQLLDNLINFFAVFLLVLVPTALLRQVHPLALLLLPVPFFFLFLGIFGMCWTLAVTQVFLRDTRFIVSFAFGILFYLTPIFYPVGFVPERLRWVVAINPVYYLIQPFRYLLHDFNLHEFARSCGSSAVVSVAFTFFAYVLWRRKRNDVYHAL